MAIYNYYNINAYNNEGAGGSTTDWIWSPVKNTSWASSKAGFKGGGSGSTLPNRAVSKLVFKLPDYGVDFPLWVVVRVRVKDTYYNNDALNTRIVLCRSNNTFDANSVKPSQVLASSGAIISDLLRPNAVTSSSAFLDEDCTKLATGYVTKDTYIYFRLNISTWTGEKKPGREFVLFGFTEAVSNRANNVFSAELISIKLKTEAFVTFYLNSEDHNGKGYCCFFNSTDSSQVDITNNTQLVNYLNVPKNIFFEFQCTPKKNYQYAGLRKNSGGGQCKYSGGKLSGTLSKDTSLTLLMKPINMTATFDPMGVAIDKYSGAKFNIKVPFSESPVNLNSIESNRLDAYVVGRTVGESQIVIPIEYHSNWEDNQSLVSIARKFSTYEFGGWSLSIGGEAVSSITPNENVNLYAKWNTQSTTYRDNEVTLDPIFRDRSSTVSLNVIFKDEQNDIESRTFSGQANFVFKQWKNSDGEVVNVGDTVDYPVTLYAQWQASSVTSNTYNEVVIEQCYQDKEIELNNSAYAVDEYEMYNHSTKTYDKKSIPSLNTLKDYLYLDPVDGVWKASVVVKVRRKYTVTVMRPSSSVWGVGDTITWVAGKTLMVPKGDALNYVDVETTEASDYSFAVQVPVISMRYSYATEEGAIAGKFNSLEGSPDPLSTAAGKMSITPVLTDIPCPISISPPTISINKVTQTAGSIAVSGDTSVYLLYKISRRTLDPVIFPGIKGYFNSSDMVYFSHFYSDGIKQFSPGLTSDNVPFEVEAGEGGIYNPVCPLTVSMYEVLPPSLPNVYMNVKDPVSQDVKLVRVAPDGNETFGDYFPSYNGTALYIKTEDGWKIAHSVYIMVNIDGKKSFETYATKLGESSQNTLDYGVLDKMVLQ